MDAIAPSDATAWSLGAEAIEGGVSIQGDLVLDGRGLQFGVALTRAEARAFARTILAAAGDGTERTYPEPSREAGRG